MSRGMAEIEIFQEVKSRHFPDWVFPKKVEKTAALILRDKGEEAALAYLDGKGKSDKFKKFLEANFPGLQFLKRDIIRGAKLLKVKGEEAALAYLAGKGYGEAPNFQAPAKAVIIAQSRPFSEWPIMKVSLAIQWYFYGLTLAERKASVPGKSKESHAAWFTSTGIPTFGYTSVQGLNIIFTHALGRYDGVIKKVENGNDKNKARVDRLNERRREKGDCREVPYKPDEQAFDASGRLLQPPGFNPNLYIYQQVSPKPYNPSQGVILPPEYVGYARNPDATLPLPVPRDRLTIPKGEPGWIPPHQREGLSTRKNKRVYFSGKKPTDALLVTIQVEEDWVVLDVRGLLRNARWRRVAKREVTLNELMSFFTGDPVIDTQRGVATFAYKPEVLGIHSRKWLPKGKQTKEVLEKLTAKGTVGLVAIDLGQTNPVAAGLSRVNQIDGKLEAERIESFTLPEAFLEDIQRYREKRTKLELRLRDESVLGLPSEMQAEIAELNLLDIEKLAAKTQQQLCKVFSLEASQFPWQRMTSNTTYISEALLAAGVSRDQVYFIPSSRKKKKKRKKPPTEVMRKDYAWASAYKPRLSEETQEARSEALWALKRKSKEYQTLSRWKQQICRAGVNYVVQKAKSRTQCTTVVVVLEDLDVRFFHGSGKRSPGWENFFTYKRENRWFIQGFHKAFSDLSVHRGVHVFEVMPHRTSITCPHPDCRNCDHDNRDGEAFVCSRCHRTYHADLDVATANLTTVALTGKTMPKPDREQSGDTETSAPARKSKKGRKSQRDQYRQLAEEATTTTHSKDQKETRSQTES